MKKCVVGIVIALSVNGVQGEDGLEWLKKSRIVDVVSVTSSNLTLQITNGYFHVSQDSDSRRKFLEEGKTNKVWAKQMRGSPEFWKNDEALVLTPDQEIQFSEDHGRITFKPVSYKSQHKGFRLTRTIIGAFANRSMPDITYIVLSDTPMEMGEDDVEMVYDKGAWVKAEDSKSLIVEKLGWIAEMYIVLAEETMQDPVRMARTLDNPKFAKIWNTLVEEGLIKQKKE